VGHLRHLGDPEPEGHSRPGRDQMRFDVEETDVHSVPSLTASLPTTIAE
jgi:hypothetical protein